MGSCSHVRIAVLLLVVSSFHSATLRADEIQGTGDVSEIKVKTFWNIRFSRTPELQVNKAGLADLYVPVRAGDAVSTQPIEPAEPTEQFKETDSKRVSGNALSAAAFHVSGPLRPAIVVVHGGGWFVGDKWSLATYSRQLAETGCCVLNINYRLAPYSKFPAQVDDVREAILFLVDHADQYRIDPARIGLFGYSAGGHLSALVGVMSDETPEVQASSSDWSLDDPRWSRMPKVAAVCAGGPPCDLRVVPIDSEALSFFLTGTRRQFPAIYTAASPTAHASAGDPPTHLIHGEKDMIVPVQSSESFAEALKNAGAAAALTVVENQGHLVTLMHPTTQKTVMEFFTTELLNGTREKQMEK